MAFLNGKYTSFDPSITIEGGGTPEEQFVIADAINDVNMGDYYAIQAVDENWEEVRFNGLITHIEGLPYERSTDDEWEEVNIDTYRARAEGEYGWLYILNKPQEFDIDMIAVIVCSEIDGILPSGCWEKLKIYYYEIGEETNV